MSEKTTEKHAAKNTEKNTDKRTTEKKTSKDDVLVSKESAKAEKLSWTLERCKKYARQYTSEVLWASGAPASYKSAVAHGWRDICLAEIEIAQGNRQVSRAVSEKKAA
jgi:hypothetical protein